METANATEINANPILKENTEIQNPEIQNNSYEPESESCSSVDTTVPASMRYEMKKAIETIDRRVNGVDEYVAEKLGYIVGKCSLEERKEGLKCLCDAFSAEQVDAIAVAIYNIENRKQAVIIGDQTGIGKGRIAAGIIRYGMRSGIKPIFLTEKPNLFSDIFRDLIAIGSDDAIPLEILDGYRDAEKRTQKSESAEDSIDETEDSPDSEEGAEIIKVPIYKSNKGYPDSYTYTVKDEDGKETLVTRRRVNSAVPFIVNGSGSNTSIKDEEGNILYKGLGKGLNDAIINKLSVPKEYDFVLATYSQFRSSKENEKMFFLRAIAQDNIFILDEAHNASGSSFSGIFLTNILKASRGVTFLSATFAKRPDNMPIYASKTAIQDANMNSDQLVAAIEQGGVALQEILSSQLVSEGQMIRRERSFEGIEVNYINLDSSQLQRGFPNLDKEQEHKAISDISTEIIRDIMVFQRDYVDPIIESLDKEAKGEMSEVESRKGTAEGGVNNTPVFNGIFQMVSQLLFSIKAEAVAEVAIERLKEGKKPVIAFANTMESFLDSYTNDDGSPIKTGDIINVDFSKVLDRRLETVLKYTVIEPNGDREYKKIEVSEMDADFKFAYNRIREKIKKASTGITFSPIDVIRKKIIDAGFSVEEVTGRTSYIDILNDNEGVVKSRTKINATDAFRNFNNNITDCLMINQSGSTGASAHAIPTKKVQKDKVKQRVMIILQAELNINTEVQKRGRINRTGQILKPIYDYVTSAIPAEKRLMMMLQKKLKSLDANTTSNQKQSKKVLDVNDFLNKYGDQVVVEYLKENKEINALIGDPLKLEKAESDSSNAGEDKKSDSSQDGAHRVSGRVAILSTKMQEDFYKEMTDRYASLVEYLVQTGDYDLEVESLNLEAETISKSVIIEGKDGGSVFSRNSIIEKCEVNALKKPMKKVEVEAMINEVLGDSYKDGKQLQEAQKVQFADWIKSSVERDLKEDLERWERVENNITSEKGYAKAETEIAKRDYVENRERDIEESRETSQDRIKTSYSNRKEVVDNLLKFFYTGKVVGYPTRVYSIDNSFMKGVVIGVHIDTNLKNPYAPSAIKIRIALASSDKFVALPASKIDIVSMIKSITYSEIMSYEEDDFLDKWDNIVKSKTADRQTRYIVTGNILQAFARPELKGKLISYTVKGGGTKKGILLPEEFNPDRQKSKEGYGGESKIRITVPIEKALPIIKSAQTNRSITTNDGITLIRKHDGYKFIVSVNKQKYGKFYLNEVLNKLTVTGRFDKSGGNMTADIEDKKIDNVIRFLGNEFNSTVDLIQSEYDMIKGDKGSDLDYDDVTKESTEIILDKFTEVDAEGERQVEEAKRKEQEAKDAELASAEQRLEEAKLTERKLEMKRKLIRLASLLESTNGGGKKYERGGGIDSHDEHIDRINDLEVSHKMDLTTMRAMTDFMEKLGVLNDWNEYKQSVKFSRGGFLYEVNKVGGSEDLRDRIISAKNLIELKKKIIEKYGTTDGITVNRRSVTSGAFYPVKFDGGGEVYNPNLKGFHVVFSKFFDGKLSDNAYTIDVAALNEEDAKKVAEQKLAPMKIKVEQVRKFYRNGGAITSDWGNSGATPSNNEDYNNLYAMFPDNHEEAKAIWNQLSEKQKEGFIYDLDVTDAASEHISDSWLEFVNAKDEQDWLDNATNWDLEEYAKGGAIGTLSTTYSNPLDYLRAMGANVNSDLNYSTKKNGINYYIGEKNRKAIVVAFIEDGNNYMIDKEDAREMAETAKTKGIESLELYTNYGLELRSTEKPKDIGFDKIYKVTKEYKTGGSVEQNNGQRTKEYLNSISEEKRNSILENIAKHYGISKSEVESEVVDNDAEALYEYIANNQSLRMSVYNDLEKKFKSGGGISDKPTKKSEKEISYLKKMGYDIDVYSTLNRDSIFGGEKIEQFIIATQGSIGKGKESKFAIAYWYRDDEDGEVQINKDLLNEISDLFKGHSVVLFTNAGVDLHSKNKGEYKNIKVVKVPYGEFSGNSDEFAKGGGINAYDSTKVKMKGKSQQERIDSLIEFVKQSNWSRKPITVKDNMVIVFSQMYDLEPKRVASIFNKHQKQ